MQKHILMLPKMKYQFKSNENLIDTHFWINLFFFLLSCFKSLLYLYIHRKYINCVASCNNTISVTRRNS